MKNLKEITKKELESHINRTQFICDKSGSTYSFYLEDAYCENPEIIMRKDNDISALYSYNVPMMEREYIWRGYGRIEPYRISKEELVKALWKIIQRDYQ